MRMTKGTLGLRRGRRFGGGPRGNAVSRPASTVVGFRRYGTSRRLPFAHLLTFRRSIDLNYQDPRPESVRKAEQSHRDTLRADRERLEREWEETKRLAQEADEPEPSKPKELLEAERKEKTFSEGEEGDAVQPNWDESPIEVSRLIEDVERPLTVPCRRSGGAITRYSRTLRTPSTILGEFCWLDRVNHD